MAHINETRKILKPEIIVTGRPDTVVRVRLVQDDVTFKVWLEVAVKCNTRPRLWGTKKVNADETPEKLRYLVQEAAEHIAAFQVHCYQDRHNATEVGKAAMAALADVFAAAQQRKGGSHGGK